MTTLRQYLKTPPFFGESKDAVVPVLRPSGVRVQVATAGASSTAATALPTGARVIEVVLVGDVDAYINFGGDAVAAVADATSKLFVAGEKTMAVPLDASGVPYTHFAVIRRQSTNVLVQIERMD